MYLRIPHKLLLGVLMALLLFSSDSAPHTKHTAQAQGGGTLTYGALAFGSIAPQTPVQLYSFNGTQGDLVDIHLRGTSNSLRPFVDLLGPNRQTIATGRQDSFAANLSDVQITLLLPETGVYSLMLGGLNDTSGDYVLELNGRGAVDALPLTFGQPLPVTVASNADPQYFSFSTTTCPTAFSVLSPSGGTPYTFPFIVKVRDSRGQIVSILRGGDALEDRVTVPAQSGSYDVEVWSADPALNGTLTLLVSCAGDPVPCLDGDMTSDATTANDGDGECPECPSCPSDESDDPLCTGFGISVDENAGGLVTISWPEVEGANAAIISVANDAGDLVYARMVVDTLTDTINLLDWGTGPGTYTVHVSVGAEDAGYSLCADTIAVNPDDLGPVGWGPAAGDSDECFVDIVAPRDTIANGLQTIFWTDVPGAESFWLRVFGEFDSVVAEGVISAPATSMTLDLSEAAIGTGYDGSNDFYLQIDARRGGERWCANGVRVTRMHAGEDD